MEKMHAVSGAIREALIAALGNAPPTNMVLGTHMSVATMTRVLRDVAVRLAPKYRLDVTQSLINEALTLDTIGLDAKICGIVT
jgi:hypothetical protein